MSNEILTQAENNYLRSLQENPLWNSILKTISAYESLPRYSTKLDKEKNNDQYSLWVYRSGGMDATDGIISLLSLNSTGVKDGK